MRRAIVSLCFLLGVLIVYYCADPAQGQTGSPILKVGVLFSQTGTMAESEKPLVEATLLAIEKVNELGIPWKGEQRLRLKAVVKDGGSEPASFAKQATELITRDKVTVILGCWTSDSRKAVLEVLKQRGGLLFYPVQYEGYEDSPNCVYSGLTANQQIFPALDWLMQNGAHRIYLVGSDYVFPHTANDLTKHYLADKSMTVVGTSYKLRGATDFSAIAADIVAKKADAILNTVNGDSLGHFLAACQKAGISHDKTPMVCTSMAEVEARQIGDSAIGVYSSCSYFMSLNSPLNERFIETFKKAYGADQVVDDPMAAAGYQVYALAQALSRCHSGDPGRLRNAVKGLILDSPGGLVRYDPHNLHCWKVVRIGRVVAGGQFRVVWSSELPIRPEPHPTIMPPDGSPAR